MNVSLIIPSIRPEHWSSLVSDMNLSCQAYDYEIIFVGPYPLPSELVHAKGVKYIKDFGCPSRCVQIGSLISEGEYIAWASDDCRICVNSFDEAIEVLDRDEDLWTGMNMRYSEGANYEGTQHEDPTYWIARTHTDLRLPGVKEGFRIAPIAMYRTKTYYQFGGLDCSMEHVNFNTHDLAFRIQARGGKIIDSPSRVFQFDWQPEKKDYQPILMAFIQNDRPLFGAIYSNENAAKEREINLDNWRKQSRIWGRRF